MVLVVRPFMQGVVFVVTAIVATAAAYAQVHPHPGAVVSTSERDIARMIDDGMVRRAYDELRRLQAAERSAARDALPFDRSAIERRSGNRAAADRVMDDFLRTRPNAPGVPLALMERGMAALEAGADADAVRYLTQAAAAAVADRRLRGDDPYRAVQHTSLFWSAAALARSGHFREALETFRMAAVADTAGAWADHAWFAIGQLYERNGQYDSAMTVFRDVRTRWPRGPVVLAARLREAQNSLVLRRPERAADALSGIDRQLVAAAAGDTTVVAPQRFAETATEQRDVLQAQIATQRGNHTDAYQRCERFLQDFPSSPYRFDIHLHGGYNALVLDQPAKALMHYDAVVDSVADETSPLRQQALLYRAVALQRLGRRAEAIQAFAALASQTGYPYQAQASLELGQAAYEDGEFEKARKALDRAEREAQDATTTVRAQLLLGATFIELGQWSKAAAAYERAELRAAGATEAFMPDRQRYLAEARLKRGISLVQAGQHRPAIAALTEFLGSHPTDTRRDEATFWLAEAMYREDLLRNAQEHYQDVINRFTASPRREEAMYGLAWTYFRRRDFNKATATFGQLLQAFPTSRYAVDALARRGDGYYIGKQYRSAAEAYAEAARRGPRTEEGQYAAFQSSQAYYRSGALDQARQHARTFVETYPSSRLADDAFYLIGWIDFEQERFEQAIVELRKLVEIYTTGDMAVRALYTVADAEYNLGRIDDAMATYRSVIQRYPSHPLAAEAARSMLMAYQGLGRTDEAIAVADTFILANPSSRAAEDFSRVKANIYYSGKNYTNAAQELEAYLKKYPSGERRDESLYFLGRTYLAMDDMVQAMNAFGELDRNHAASDYVPQAKLEMADYYRRTANSAKADSLYAVVYNQFADDTASASRAGFDRAGLMRLRGDTTAALVVYTTIADRYPDTEYGDQARFQSAMIHRKAQRVDSMRYHLGILGTRVNAPLLAANALYLIGQQDVLEKRCDAAVVIFERVRSDFAGYEDWYTLSMLALGECYETLAQKDRALEVYGVVASLRPEDDYGKLAVARMKRLERKR